MLLQYCFSANATVKSLFWAEVHTKRTNCGETKREEQSGKICYLKRLNRSGQKCEKIIKSRKLLESRLSAQKSGLFLGDQVGTQTENEKKTSQRIPVSWVWLKEMVPTLRKKKDKTGFGNVVGVTETNLNKEKWNTNRKCWGKKNWQTHSV